MVWQLPPWCWVSLQFAVAVFSILIRKNPAKSGLGTAGLVLGIIASVLAIISIIVAQTDWYQTTVTQQLIDTFGDQYADMLN